MYTVQISAQNAEGEGPRSNELSVKTLEDGMFHKHYVSTGKLYESHLHELNINRPRNINR